MFKNYKNYKSIKVQAIFFSLNGSYWQQKLFKVCTRSLIEKIQYYERWLSVYKIPQGSDLKSCKMTKKQTHEIYLRCKLFVRKSAEKLPEYIRIDSAGGAGLQKHLNSYIFIMTVVSLSSCPISQSDLAELHFLSLFSFHWLLPLKWTFSFLSPTSVQRLFVRVVIKAANILVVAIVSIFFLDDELFWSQHQDKVL